MSTFLHWLLPDNFMPHGHCYLWRPDVLWLNVGSDSVIAASYFAIPLAIVHLVRRRSNAMPFSWMPALFAAFIVLCGTTHLLGVWTVWNPDYVVDGLVKLATAVASAITAASLILIMPRLLALRTPLELQAEVDARTREYAEANARLREEIAARERVEAELQEKRLALEQAVRELREADRRKDEFLATLAHELRNPMAPIRYCVTLLRGKLEPEQLTRAHDTIERQTRLMSRLLDDLLEVSRITRGVITLKRERIDLRPIAREAVETARLDNEGRQREIGLRLAEEAVCVDADAARLLQVLGNLLSNAVKHTQPGGHVGVQLRAEGDRARLEVEDDGNGIAPDQLPHIFGLFVQVHPDRQSDERGLGIGLAVVKRLVELHGGRIEADSAGAGQGARFTIWLPLVAASAPAPDPGRRGSDPASGALGLQPAPG